MIHILIFINVQGLANVIPAWANLSDDPSSPEYCESAPMKTAIGVLFFKVVRFNNVQIKRVLLSF